MFRWETWWTRNYPKRGLERGVIVVCFMKEQFVLWRSKRYYEGTIIIIQCISLLLTHLLAHFHSPVPGHGNVLGLKRRSFLALGQVGCGLGWNTLGTPGRERRYCTLHDMCDWLLITKLCIIHHGGLLWGRVVCGQSVYIMMVYWNGPACNHHY